MFVPIQQKKMYEYVIDQIYSQTQSGQLQLGDRLPPERVLTDQLGISRTSVREALRALEVLGLISTQQGEGNFISGNFGPSLVQPMASLFAVNKGTRKDAIDMRMNLECMSARIAASRITPDQLHRLEEIYSELAGTVDHNARLTLDSLFHITIAEASDNVLLINMLQMVNYITTNMLKLDREELSPEFVMKTDNAHHNILVALKEGDPTKAENVMANHLNQVFSYSYKLDKVGR